VIGQRHELGSLFVALDERVEAPVVALKSIAPTGGEPPEQTAYLVESRWRVYSVRSASDGVRFVTEGYGPGEARWQWPHGSSAVVRWRSASGRSEELRVGKDSSGLLSVTLPQLTGERVDVTIAPAGDARGAK
jgi:hypothetical protein